MLHFACPYCQLLLMDDGRLAGLHFSCPKCGHTLCLPTVVEGNPSQSDVSNDQFKSSYEVKPPPIADFIPVVGEQAKPQRQHFRQPLSALAAGWILATLMAIGLGAVIGRRYDVRPTTQNEEGLAEDAVATFRAKLKVSGTVTVSQGSVENTQPFHTTEWEMDEKDYSARGLADKKMAIARYEELLQLQRQTPAAARAPVLPLAPVESDAMFAITEMQQKDVSTGDIDANLASRGLLQAANAVRARQRYEKLCKSLEEQKEAVRIASNIIVIKQGDKLIRITYPPGKKSHIMEPPKVYYPPDLYPNGPPKPASQEELKAASTPASRQ